MVEVLSLESYFDNLATWRQESLRLRSILLGFPLKEELKWNQPCYTSAGKNIAIISGFKEYCVLGFFKGALMANPPRYFGRARRDTGRTADPFH
jgi:uncharacterized protein YdeI (YjbR/CyaY-like superfamily)